MYSINRTLKDVHLPNFRNPHYNNLWDLDDLLRSFLHYFLHPRRLGDLHGKVPRHLDDLFNGLCEWTLHIFVRELPPGALP